MKRLSERTEGSARTRTKKRKTENPPPDTGVPAPVDGGVPADHPTRKSALQVPAGAGIDTVIAIPTATTPKTGILTAFLGEVAEVVAK